MLTRRDNNFNTKQRRWQSRWHVAVCMMLLLLLLTSVTASDYFSDNDASYLRRNLGENRETPAPSTTPTPPATQKPTVTPSSTTPPETTPAPSVAKPTSEPPLAPPTETATPSTPTATPSPTKAKTPASTSKPSDANNSGLSSVALEPFVVEVGGTNTIERNMLLQTTAQYLLNYFVGELENTHAVELGEVPARRLNGNDVFERQFTRTFTYQGKAVFRNQAAPENFVVAVQRLALSDLNAFQQALNDGFGADAAPTLVSAKLVNEDNGDGFENNGDNGSSSGGGDSTNIGLIVGVVVAALVLVLVGLFAWSKFRKSAGATSNQDDVEDSYAEDQTKVILDPSTPLSTASQNGTDGEDFSAVGFDVDSYSLSSFSLTSDVPPAKPTRKPSVVTSPKKKSPQSYRDIATNRGLESDNSDADDTISAFSYGNVGTGESSVVTLQSESFNLGNDDDDESSVPKRRWSLSKKKNGSPAAAAPPLLTTSQVSAKNFSTASVGEVPWDEIVVTTTNDATASQEVEVVPPRDFDSTDGSGTNGHHTAAVAITRAPRSAKKPRYRNDKSASLEDKDNLSNFLRERRRAKQNLRQKRESRRQPPAEMEV